MKPFQKINIPMIAHEIKYGSKHLMYISQNRALYKIDITQPDFGHHFPETLQAQNLSKPEHLLFLLEILFQKKVFLLLMKKISYPIFENFVFDQNEDAQMISIVGLKYEQVYRDYFYLKCFVKEIPEHSISSNIFNLYEFPLSLKLKIKNTKNTMSNIQRFSTFECNFFPFIFKMKLINFLFILKFSHHIFPFRWFSVVCHCVH
jgi:hypothetical protein